MRLAGRRDGPHLGHALAATAVMAAACGARAQTGWPELPDPPRSTVEWVARDLVVDGLPSRIEHFDSELSADEVLTYYRARWARSARGEARAVSAGGWRGLSTLDGRFQLVVQVRDKTPHGSEGMLSVANLSAFRKSPLPANWPRWSDVKTTQVTESSDGPKRSLLVAMVSTQGLDLNVRRWRDEWIRRGYGLAHEIAPQGEAGVRSWVGSFDKSLQTVDVAVAYREKDRRTYISVNLIGPVGTDMAP